MKHILIFAIAALPIVTTISTFGQEPLPDVPKGASEIKLVGRIVLYDWVQHEMTSTDDFVVEVLLASGKGSARYARVIYQPFWGGWDAPPPEPKDVLNRWAFVGTGPKWTFLVHVPRTAQEKLTCSEPVRNHKYEDETGSGEIPRFVATPGAVSGGIPPVQSLPCFILNRGGLAQAGKPGTVK
jgi:hypothetical protein